jgi:transcriptional regulator with XRE-family HTH domain
MPNDALRRAVRVYLAEHDRTQAWLSSRLHVSQSTLSEILSGYREPSDEIVKRLERLTGLDVRALQGAA